MKEPPLAQPDRVSKFLGSLVGSAFRDAIGEMAFAHPDAERLPTAVFEISQLTYTDETAMAFGIAESLVELGGLDPEQLGQRFHDNFRNEPWLGYGAGSPSLFLLVERDGLSYRELAKHLYGNKGSLGNGASMRIASIGPFYYLAANLDAQTRASATVTHAHPVGIDSAAVARAVALDPSEPFEADAFVVALIAVARADVIRGRIGGWSGT